jgi:hypothetical protein
MDSRPATIPFEWREQNKITNEVRTKSTSSFNSRSNICDCLKTRRALPVYSLERNHVYIT